MNILRLQISLIFLAMMGLSVIAQPSSEDLIEGLRNKTNRVKYFDVNATILVDVDFIDISERQVKITYQAPGKFTFEGQGLVLLPKNGVQMEYMSLLNDNYTAIDSGSETVGNTSTRIVKIIPESIESDIILAQLWIEPELLRLVRMKTFTRSSGSYLIDFDYAAREDILPSSLVVLFDINNMSMPVKMMNDFMNKNKAESTDETKEAKVSIRYSDYRITYQ